MSNTCNYFYVMKEALTPAKKNLPDWKSDDEEKVELSAFDKVLLECDQEGPVKFANVLNSRCNIHLFYVLH